MVFLLVQVLFQIDLNTVVLVFDLHWCFLLIQVQSVLIFFIDPLSAQPHDVDVKALTRLATLYDVPLANNKSTADAVLAAL